MAHTPGPWKQMGYGDVGKVIGTDKFFVAECYSLNGVDGTANARLIAAAPELLAACKAAYEFSCGSWDTDIDIEKMLGKAIAKAEGRDGDAK